MDNTFYINNLDCAHCGAKIEEAIGRLEGIESAVLNFPLKKLRISGEVTDELLKLINETARAIEPEVEIVRAKHFHHGVHEHHHHGDDCECGHEHHHGNDCECGHEHHHHGDDCECGHEHHHHGDDCECGHEHHHHADSCECGHEHTHEHCEDGSPAGELAVIAAGVLMFAGALLTGHFLSIKPLPYALYALAYIILGHGILVKTAKNIRFMNFFDENTLMTVATLGAFAINECAEAVGVILFFRIGELFEDIAVSRSRKAITHAAGLRVDEADVLVDGEFRRIDADNIKAGDIIRIKNGERIAADGIIESGESRLDTSAINGEPVPLTVRTGDSVMSGCINLGDVLTLRATAAADDSMISKIAAAVEDASAAKPKIDRFVTRFAKVYTPIVIAAALLTAVVPSLITGDWSKWVHSALTFLVISCPCALVLSVPLAYFSGIGAASRLGILFKGGDSVEALGKVRAIAFDKTGTLTDGSFDVTETVSLGRLDERQLLKLCGSCEQISSHPVAQSIVEYCKRENIALVEPESSGELAGRGVSAVIGGHRLLCGNERLMADNGIALPENTVLSGSVVYVAVDGTAEGRITVSDKLKSTSAGAVAGLSQAGIAVAMFTGDKAENAQKTGAEAGISRIGSELLPDGKLEELEKLRNEFGTVMFVGDGINDGPVLAGADVGGAMQSGSDLAIEAADVIFMNSEPVSVLRAKRIADRALRISYANIAFALAIKAAVLVLGLIGHPNMWLAVFADSGTAMLLVLNSVRMLNTKKYLK